MRRIQIKLLKLEAIAAKIKPVIDHVFFDTRQGDQATQPISALRNEHRAWQRLPSEKEDRFMQRIIAEAKTLTPLRPVVIWTGDYACEEDASAVWYKNLNESLLKPSEEDPQFDTLQGAAEAYWKIISVS
jgi:hypothetical protein